MTSVKISPRDLVAFKAAAVEKKSRNMSETGGSTRIREKPAAEKKAGLFRSKLRGSSFKSRSLILATGTCAGQAIHIAAAPLLTRLFSPEAFGVFAVYMSLSTILAVVGSLRYDGALMITSDPEETINLASLCFMVSLLFSTILFAGASLFFFFGVQMPPQVAGMGWTLYLVPAAVFVLSSQSILRLSGIRRDRFGSVSLSGFVQGFSENGVKIAAGAAGFVSPLGLIAGHLAGGIGATIYLLRKLRRCFPNGKLWKIVRKEKMQAVGSRYRAFPLYNSWSSLINVVSLQAPALMLGWLFDLRAAGFYLLAQRVLKVPVRLLGQAVSDSLFKEAADRKRTGRRILPFVLKVIGLLAGVIAVPLLAALFFGEFLFEMVFGREWGTSGLYVTIMAPWIAMQFLTSAVSAVFSVLEKNKILSGLQLMLLASTLVPFLFAGRLGHDDVQVIILLSAFNFLAYAAYGLAAVWICRSHDAGLRT